MPRASLVWLFVTSGLAATLGCGGSEGSGGSGGTGGSGGGATATVRGVVSDEEEEPFVGATVSVGKATATSGPGGAFTIESPVGTELFLTTAAEHWGSLVPEIVPTEGVDDLETFVITDALIESIGTTLGIPIDAKKGIVLVTFDLSTAAAGDKASISAANAASFVFDAGRTPILSNELTAGGVGEGSTEVAFLNVDPGDRLTVTASNVSNDACPLEYPTVAYSVQARVLTDIAVICP